MRLRRSSLEASLAEAYDADPGCPEPRTFLAGSWSALAEAEQRRIESHAERCPRCAAERDLARAFDEGAEADRARDRDLDWVVSRLERARPAAAHAAWRRIQTWRWAAAAAAVLVVAAAAFLAQRPGAPPLAPPRSGAPAVLRGSALEILGPEGDVAEAPAELRFSAVEGAERYRVRLVAVDDAVLWDETVREARAPLPPAVREALRPAVTYRWRVEALDAAGAVRALSGEASFRVVPSEGGATR